MSGPQLKKAFLQIVLLFLVLYARLYTHLPYKHMIAVIYTFTFYHLSAACMTTIQTLSHL